MMANKKFDCVKMKNSIQEKLAEQRKGLSDQEIEAQIEKDLEISEVPIAQFWRKASKAQKKQLGIRIAAKS